MMHLPPHLGLLHGLLKVLLTSRLALKHVVDRRLLVQCHLREARAQLKNSHTAIRCTDSHRVARLVCRERRQAMVRDLNSKIKT